MNFGFGSTRGSQDRLIRLFAFLEDHPLTIRSINSLILFLRDNLIFSYKGSFDFHSRFFELIPIAGLVILIGVVGLAIIDSRLVDFLVAIIEAELIAVAEVEVEGMRVVMDLKVQVAELILILHTPTQPSCLLPVRLQVGFVLEVLVIVHP